MSEDARALTSPEVCKVCQERCAIFNDALNRSREVVVAAQNLRKVMRGTMALLGPTGLKFCEMLDKYEAEKDKPGRFK